MNERDAPDQLPGTLWKRFWDGLGKAQIPTILGLFALILAGVSAMTDLHSVGWLLAAPSHSQSPPASRSPSTGSASSSDAGTPGQSVSAMASSPPMGEKPDAAGTTAAGAGKVVTTPAMTNGAKPNTAGSGVDACVVGRWRPVDGELRYAVPGSSASIMLHLHGDTNLQMRNDPDGNSKIDGVLVFEGSGSGYQVRLEQVSDISLHITTNNGYLKREHFVGQIADTVYINGAKAGPANEELTEYTQPYSCTGSGFNLTFEAGRVQLEKIR